MDSEPIQPVTTIFGGTRIGNRDLFMPDTSLEAFLAALTRHQVAKIDTAQAYGDSESTLGHIQAGDRFTFDTKWSPPSWTASTVPWATEDHILASAKESIRKLSIDQVDIFYLHRPDPRTPISQTLAGVNNAYKRGLFRRFGLSGHSASQVEAVYNYCSKHNYPLPVVYQGSYNPLNRHKETALLVTLRRLNISFYAYGTSAGGFLTKGLAQIETMVRDGATVSATCRPYLHDANALKALVEWNTVADSEGTSPAELTYRWIAHHSALSRNHGDAFIVGASSPQQLEETLCGIEKGPLSQDACVSIEAIWERFK